MAKSHAPVESVTIREMSDGSIRNDNSINSSHNEKSALAACQANALAVAGGNNPRHQKVPIGAEGQPQDQMAQNVVVELAAANGANGGNNGRPSNTMRKNSSSLSF